MKYFFFKIAILILLCPINGALASDLEEIRVISAKSTYIFNVEIAANKSELAKGLMFRTELAERSGMLFHFQKEKIIKMWMKNTLISLDMIFINKKGNIVKIAKNTTPESLESISSIKPALAVLEIIGGYSDKIGIKTGDRVKHKIFNNVVKDNKQEK